MKNYTLFRFLLICFFSVALIGCEKYDNFYHSKKQTVSSPATNDSNVRTAYLNEGAGSVTLFAGQNIDAGTVDFEQVNNSLIITYNTTNGFGLAEVHLWAGHHLADMPQTNNGNPKVGQFPFSATNLGGSTSYQFTIPLSFFGTEHELCNDAFYIAAHASLEKENSNGTTQTETGWGDGVRFVENGNWATYFSFMFDCVTKDQPGSECKATFAFGELTFTDLNIVGNQWGWVIKVKETGTFQTPLYLGASQNNLANAILVGKLNYTYDGSILTVNYIMQTGYKMSETHLYASYIPPIDDAPGQFGHVHDLSFADTDEYTIEVNGNPIYIVAHAFVCSEIY